MRICSVILNSVLAVDMIVMTILLFLKDGKWDFETGVRRQKYFTALSNEFCAITCVFMIFFPDFYPVRILKFTGVIAVMVTFVTVLVFLGPTLGYRRVMEGRDFVLHVVNPVLAAISFGVFEREKIAFPHCLFGMVPVILYGIVYIYFVMLAPKEKRGEDFYGFNKGNKWYLSMTLMVLGTLILCVGFWAITLI